MWKIPRVRSKPHCLGSLQYDVYSPRVYGERGTAAGSMGRRGVLAEESMPRSSPFHVWVDGGQVVRMVVLGWGSRTGCSYYRF